ncbi:MAG TPA: CAP domain-containing protein [Polyangiaceae bacterium]|nr:CAP domain-containing protein [Polyangiaceae bacterium]
MRGSRFWDLSLFVVACSVSFAACASVQHAAAASTGPTPVATPTPVTASKGTMNVEQARRYVLGLVNRDRAAHGLPAVVLDETANRAGQRHAEDMARAGYTAHWGTDGSVPEERYSDAGGTDFVQENAGCLADGESRVLDTAPRFAASELERVEHAFMDEKPPLDGHRKNILKAGHSALGIGVAKPKGVPLACLSQEFLDDYGDYAALPMSTSAGSMLHIEGDVKGPVSFGGVGIGRIDPAAPLTAAHLNTTYLYVVPSPVDLYFPKGFVTKKPVEVHGKHFRIDVPLGKAGQAGRYEVSIWGKFPGAGERLDMISLRVVHAK